MSSTLHPHPGNEALLRLLDGDLSPAERQLVEGHLATCAACQRELEEVREAVGDYQQFHETVLKAATPPAPKPWDLALPAGRRKPQRLTFTFAPRRWLAAAAAVAAAFVVVRLAERMPQVRAAELLHKAVAAQKAAPVRSRSIRIQSRTRRWDRPARLSSSLDAASSDASGIRQLLESAGYNWEDPLSADAYAAWHDRLAQKEDRVDTLAQAYVIRTSTASSPISDATLTLGRDLHAVACTLRFGGAETVEMSELPDEKEEKPAAVAAVPKTEPPASSAPPSASPPPPAGPGDELRVVAALHRIGADLGEPIDVRREGGSVMVNVTGLDARRTSEVKAALSGLAGVQLHFGEPAQSVNREEPRRPAPQVDTANPLLAELQAALPNDTTTADLADQLTDHTESIMGRAYALRGLARRFPTGVSMTASESATLAAIVRDHAGAIGASTAAIERLLRPILPTAKPAAGLAERSWQEIAQALVTDARRLDQSIHAAGDPGRRKLDAAQALADINRRLAQLRTVLQP